MHIVQFNALVCVTNTALVIKQRSCFVLFYSFEPILHFSYNRHSVVVKIHGRVQ